MGLQSHILKTNHIPGKKIEIEWNAVLKQNKMVWFKPNLIEIIGAPWRGLLQQWLIYERSMVDSGDLITERRTMKEYFAMKWTREFYGTASVRADVYSN